MELLKEEWVLLRGVLCPFLLHSFLLSEWRLELQHNTGPRNNLDDRSQKRRNEEAWVLGEKKALYNLNYYLFTILWEIRKYVYHSKPIFKIFSFFWLCHLACRILVPWPGTEPGPQQWKCRVLTTGPPGNSLFWFSIMGSANFL